MKRRKVTKAGLGLPLNDDLLCCVASWLTVSEHVRWAICSRRLHQTLNQPRAWQTIHFGSCPYSAAAWRTLESMVSSSTVHLYAPFPDSEIRFYGNPHPRKGSIRNLDFLSPCVRLRYLNLSGHSVDRADALRHCVALETAILSGTNLRRVRFLRHVPSLKKLSLSQCPLSHYEDFLEAGPHLEKLYLERVHFHYWGFLDRLRSRLTRLRLFGKDVTDVSVLSDCPQLKVLALQRTSVTDWGFLAGCPALKHLNLRHTPMRSADLKYLSHCPHLISLILYGENIRDISAVSALTKLEHFETHSTAIEDVTPLSRCVGLKSLILRHVGGVSVRNVACLASCPHLKSLSVGVCEEVEAFSSLPSLQTLSVSFSASVPSLQPLSLCSQLRSLTVSWKRTEQPVRLDMISPGSKLKKLFGWYKSSALDLTMLRHCPEIQTLYFPRSSVASAGLRVLASLKGQMRHLNLSSTDISTPDMEVFRHMPLLENVVVGRVDSVAVLAHCPRLRKLHLGSCPLLRHVDALAKCPRLRELHLGSCPLLRNVNGLARCSRLTKLSIDSCPVLETLGPLQNARRLRRLHLVSCDLITHLDEIQALPDLEEVQICNSKSLRSAKGLVSCPSLVRIRLTDCPLLSDLGTWPVVSNLKSFRATGCTRLRDIRGLSNCKELLFVELGNTDVNDVTPLEACRRLKSLTVPHWRMKGLARLRRTLPHARVHRHF